MVGSANVGGQICVELPKGNEDTEEAGGFDVVSDREVVVDVVGIAAESRLEEKTCDGDEVSEIESTEESVLDSNRGGSEGSGSTSD